ncbi:16S rRNA (cytosine(967)-C(5))-methyltransferase RsmB [Alloiococcus sp. CFN-8]|uniref:16S rRNA (cytosine(967)-C(5))-methyltransferase RsmB n=1 Tax=Alloiococcus sp. CFN-8 TaxID=3416081 RepID=UPI003CED6FF6
MKPREIAVNVLDEVLYKDGYSNLILNKELNKNNIDTKDKGLITEIVYGTLKQKYSIDKDIQLYLDRKLSTLDQHILNILRVSFYQLNYLDKVPEYAILNEAVEIAKKYKKGLQGFVNGVLRNHLRKRLTYSPINKIDELSYKYSFEPWMSKLFVNQYGNDKATEILRGLNFNPFVTLRVNSLKTNFNDAFEELKSMGYDIVEGQLSPDALHIRKGSNIDNNPLFKRGWITVQDESAMMVTEVLSPKANDVVLDLCAAPGGKTTHAADLMGNEGKILSFDIYENKLKKIKDNCDKLGIHIVETKVMDATVLCKDLVSIADKIILDVPCSGLGIIRKKPEIKWTKGKEDIKSLINIQRKIISNAISYLKEGGTLVYSTCTINKEENEENIRWLLERYPEMKLENIFFGNSDNLIYNREGVTILPNEYMDGFFISKLTKDSR